MRIRTSRLILAPLKAQELSLLVYDLPRLERRLRCSYRAEPIEGVFRDILIQQIPKAKENGSRYIFHTFFLMIRRSDRVVVGSLDYKGEPTGDGEVEIGYGLGEGFCGNGYMREAVVALCGYAFKGLPVTAITAETEPDNEPSQRVLARCGFSRKPSEKGMWWIKKK